MMYKPANMLGEAGMSSYFISEQPQAGQCNATMGILRILSGWDQFVVSCQNEMRLEYSDWPLSFNFFGLLFYFFGINESFASGEHKCLLTSAQWRLFGGS